MSDHPFTKPTEPEPETERSHALTGRQVIWIIVCIVLIPAGVFLGFQEKQRRDDQDRADQQRIADLKSSCRRGNISRDVQSQFLKIAEDARRGTARAELPNQPEQAAIDFRAAEQYSALNEKLIRGASEFAVRPGSVIIDCERAVTSP